MIHPTCTECPCPCPEHNITHCATCHKHPGECGFGDCEAKATHTFRWTSGAGDTRFFCPEHALAPAYQFARAGATLQERA